MFTISAKAAYFFIKEAGRRLNGGGKPIAWVSSLLAAYTDGYSTYAGGKSPVEHFTRVASKEFVGLAYRLPGQRGNRSPTSDFVPPGASTCPVPRTFSPCPTSPA